VIASLRMAPDHDRLARNLRHLMTTPGKPSLKDGGIWEFRAGGGTLFARRGCGPRPPNARANSHYRVDSRPNKCNVMMLKLTRYEFWDGREAERFAVR
jgi:hypothetical protein